VREGLVRTDVTDSDSARVTDALAPGMVGYVVMILLSLFAPTAAVIGYLCISVYIMVPFTAVIRGRART
jgi:hypothetical protein